MIINETDWKWKKPLSKRKNTAYLVLHHAAMIGSAADIDKIHKNNGWDGIGYHFYIRKDGSVWRGRPLDMIGAHVLNHNSNTIGVCFEGNFDSTDKTMPTKQFKAGQEIIKYIKSVYPYITIKGHRDLMATACPGKYFPFNEIIKIEEENEPMTVKEREEFEALKKEVEELRRTNKVYKYTQDVPEWARPTIQKLLDKGIYKGNAEDDLGLTDEIMRILVLNDRTGLYDK